MLLLVGFIGALRRSELGGIDIEHLEAHDKGLVLHIPRSKVNQTGATDELVVLPPPPPPAAAPSTPSSPGNAPLASTPDRSYAASPAPDDPDPPGSTTPA